MLPGGAEITVIRNWIPKVEADSLYNSLFKSTPWEQPRILIAGKEHAIPRLQAWCGRADAAFTYSGKRFVPTPLSKDIDAIKSRVEHEFQLSFNSVLINLYRDENDSVGWHADDEKEFGDNPVIASLSLGGARRFFLKPKAHCYQDANWYRGKRSIVLSLHTGDLIVMRENVQLNWLHSVPKERKPCESRINLTFRKVIMQ